MSKRENDNGKVACFAYTFILLLSVYNAWIKAIHLESVWDGNKTKANKNSSAPNIIDWKTGSALKTIFQLCYRPFLS